MATEKQIAANAANAKLSTGPKTAAGRSRSSRNSLKHGIRAQQIMLLDGEEGWIDVAKEYLEHFQPVGAYQRGLVMEMIQRLLAVDRSHRAEAGLLSSGCPGKNLIALQIAGTVHLDDKVREESAASARQEDSSSTITTPLMNTPPATGTLFEVMKLQDIERAGLKLLSDNFAQNSQMLDLLRRYRTSAENSFYRALQELRRDQGLEIHRHTSTAPAVSEDANSNGLGFDALDHDERKSPDGK
jgi:hypothetical protein